LGKWESVIRRDLQGDREEVLNKGFSRIENNGLFTQPIGRLHTPFHNPSISLNGFQFDTNMGSLSKHSR
jgi:hypothetical protein